MKLIDHSASNSNRSETASANGAKSSRLGLRLLAALALASVAPIASAAPDVFLRVQENEDDEFLVNEPIALHLRANTDEVDGLVEETKFWVVSPEGSFNWWPIFSGGQLTKGDYSAVASGTNTEIDRNAEFTPNRPGIWQFRSTAKIKGAWYYSDYVSVKVTSTRKPVAPRPSNTVTVKRVAYKDFYTLSELYVGNDTQPTLYAWEAPLFDVGEQYKNTYSPGFVNYQVVTATLVPSSLLPVAGTYPLYAAGYDSPTAPFAFLEMRNVPNLGGSGLPLYGDYLGTYGYGFSVGTSKGANWDFMKRSNENPTPSQIGSRGRGVDDVVTFRALAMAALANRLGVTSITDDMKYRGVGNIVIPAVPTPRRLILDGSVHEPDAMEEPEALPFNEIKTTKQNKRIVVLADVYAKLPKLAGASRQDDGLSIPNNRVFVVAKIDYGPGVSGRYETVNVGAAQTDRIGQAWIGYTTPRLKTNSQGRLVAATVTFTIQSDMLRAGERPLTGFPAKHIGSSPRSTARITITP